MLGMLVAVGLTSSVGEASWAHALGMPCPTRLSYPGSYSQGNDRTAWSQAAPASGRKLARRENGVFWPARQTSPSGFPKVLSSWAILQGPPPPPAEAPRRKSRTGMAILHRQCSPRRAKTLTCGARVLELLAMVCALPFCLAGGLIFPLGLLPMMTMASCF